MKYLILIAACLLAACGEKNPLLGTWYPDGERTLSQIRSTEPVPELMLRCFETSACGTGHVEYLPDTYITVLHGEDGKVYSRKSAPYEVVEVHSGYVVIDQFENGGQFTLYFENEHSMYIKSEYGFNEYFVRTK